MPKTNIIVSQTWKLRLISVSLATKYKVYWSALLCTIWSVEYIYSGILMRTCIIKILHLYIIIQLFEEFTSSALQSSTHWDSNIGLRCTGRFIIAWELSFSVWTSSKFIKLFLLQPLTSALFTCSLFWGHLSTKTTHGKKKLVFIQRFISLRNL